MWKYINPGLSNTADEVYSFANDTAGTSWNGMTFTKRAGFGLNYGNYRIKLPNNTKNMYMKFDIAYAVKNTDYASDMVIELPTSNGKIFKISGTGSVNLNISTPFGSKTAPHSLAGITSAYISIEQVNNTVRVKYYWNGLLSIDETYENTLGDFDFSNIHLVSGSLYFKNPYGRVMGVISNLIISDTKIPFTEEVTAIPLDTKNNPFNSENDLLSTETAGSIIMTPNAGTVNQLITDKCTEVTGLCTIARKLYRDGEGLKSVSSVINDTEVSKKEIITSEKVKYFSCTADKIDINDFTDYEIGLRIE